MSRRSFTADATLKDRLFDLLETSFPGIGKGASRVPLEGGRWEECSTPFTVDDNNGRPIAHVGVLPMPAIVAGESRRLLGVHAVCTHPDYRGKGHCRRLMEEVIDWTGGETLLLFTSQPALYERFGFRRLEEHRFEAPVTSAGGECGFRPISPHVPADLHFLTELLSGREPVSSIFGITGEERGVFAFNCPDEGLWYSPELRAIAWMEMHGGMLRIYDIIAPQVPPLDAILSRWPAPVRRVEMLFAPDRLKVSASAIRYQHDGYLMVRGRFAVEGHFMVPPTAHC